MAFDIKIEKAYNGYILCYKNDNDVEVFEIFEDDELKEDSEVDALKNLFWRLSDLLGPAYDKHKKYNIFICTDKKNKVRDFKHGLDEKENK